MKQDETLENRDERSLLSISKAEAAVAIVLFALGAIAIYGARQVGASWGEDGPQAGYFPFYIGLILCISSVINFYQGVWGKKKTTGPFVTRGPFKQVLWVLIPSTLFVGLVQLIGIYAAAAIYIAFFMRVIGKYSWLQTLLIAIGVNVFFFFMFEVWFLVPLYKGIYNPLSFTGY